jgi:hypothetical protein
MLQGARLWIVVIVLAVALVGFGSVMFSRGESTSSSTSSSSPSSNSSSSSSVAGATAVPTLDFFRGRSYPTPTAQPAP